MEETAALRKPSRAGVCRAVIDVGTNSVKLLVAEVESQNIRPLYEASKVTRLGRGFYETHLLQPEAIAKTAEVIGEFARRANTHGAQSLRIVATSAARDARNAAELIEAIRRSSGHEIEIISGEQEADWAFRGVTSDPRMAGHPLLIMDVGGGSTEFIVGHGGHPTFGQSFQLGVVRLLENLRPDDPPRVADLAHCRRHLREFFSAEVSPTLRPALDALGHERAALVGVGGSATVLASMQLELREFDRDRLEGFRVSRADVIARTEPLWSLPLARRPLLPGRPPKRADVILTGAAIYEAVMEVFGFDTCRVSTRGLRYAALLDVP